MLFFLRSLWENLYSVLRQYHYYVVAYLIISSVISFGVCYRFGPLTDTRSLHLLQWSLQVSHGFHSHNLLMELNLIEIQAIGLVLMFVSSEYKEAITGIILVVLCLHSFPRSWTGYISTIWYVLSIEDEYFYSRVILLYLHFFNTLIGCRRQRFPPKVRPLTEDEYLDQGRLETKKALDELRDYCKSPQCNAWKTMGRLKEPMR